MVFLEQVIDMCCANYAGEKTDQDKNDVNETSQSSETQPKHLKYSNKDIKFDGIEYAKLLPTIRVAVKALGFTEDSWNNGDWPACENKWFEDLTQEERRAAETLGWTKEAWDSQFKQHDWRELPENIRRAAVAAGYTEEKWKHNERPKNLDKSWNELEEEDKQHMNVLGYTRWDWD